jgi:hypothetical protein
MLDKQAAGWHAEDEYHECLPFPRESQPRQRVQADANERIFKGFVILVQRAVASGALRPDDMPRIAKLDCIREVANGPHGFLCTYRLHKPPHERAQNNGGRQSTGRAIGCSPLTACPSASMSLAWSSADIRSTSSWLSYSRNMASVAFVRGASMRLCCRGVSCNSCSSLLEAAPF